MTRTGLRSLIVVSCTAVFATVGCGQGSPLSSAGAPGSLVGPTALTADADFDAASALIADDESGVSGEKGRGNGGGNSGGDKENKGEREEKDKGEKDKGPKGGDEAEADADVDADDDEDADGTDPKPRRGSLSGFVTEKGTNTITVRGVVVTVTSATIIRHGFRILTIADITEGDHVQVKGTSTTDATGTTFTADEIKVEDMDGKDGDDDVNDDNEIEGLISGQTGTCPALTFTVGTKSVTTNASTEFDDGACADLANGKTVEVEGTLQADGSILATKVDLEDATAETEGALSGLTGTCPALTFTVATKTITTNAATTFEDVACSALLNGSVVEVRGTAQADGSILATNVELD